MGRYLEKGEVRTSDTMNHRVRDEKRNTVCWFYKYKECKSGKKCSYWHPPDVRQKERDRYSYVSFKSRDHGRTVNGRNNSEQRPYYRSQRPCGWSPGIKRSSVSTENLFKRKAKPKYTFFRISTEPKSWVNINRDRAEADPGRVKTAPVAEGVYPNGDKRPVSCETVEPETTFSSTFHTNTPQIFM